MLPLPSGRQAGVGGGVRLCERHHPERTLINALAGFPTGRAGSLAVTGGLHHLLHLRLLLLQLLHELLGLGILLFHGSKGSIH
jgi:hypothetical protein